MARTPSAGDERLGAAKRHTPFACNLAPSWCVLVHVDDKADLTSFLEARSRALLAYAYRLTGSQHAAEDLLQSVLVKTVAAWPRVIRKEDPEGYIRRAMARAAMNRWRIRGREVTQEAVADAVAADALALFDRRDQMWRALRALPPRQRTVLVLRYYEDLSEAEIARVLGISVGTVKSQAARGLSRLRAVIDTEMSADLERT